MVLCYALSLTAHASVMLWLANSPVNPASPWAGRPASMPDGPRQEVTVTITMRMTNLAQPGRSMPSDRLALPSDTAPTNQTLDQLLKSLAEQPTDQPDASQANTEQLAERQPPMDPRTPLDLPLPDAQSPDASADTATASTPPTPPTILPQPTDATPEPALVQSEVTQADDTESDVAPPALSAQAMEEQVRELMEVALPALAQLMQPTDQPQATSEPATEPAQQNPSAAASEPLAIAEPATPVQAHVPIASTEPVEPVEPAEAAPPPTTAASEPAEQAKPDAISTAVVYDELSVDQRVEFDRKALPTLSYKSRQFGDKGTIAILVTIDADGSLLSYEVIDDAGQPRLLASAITALEDSTFHPAQIDGQPVRSKRLIKYAF